MNYFYRLFFILLVALPILVGCDSKIDSQKSAKSAQKPNIIYIITDDLGWGDLGVYYQNDRRSGSPAEPGLLTPQLDQLARSGAQLRSHYAAAPVCAPSRASLLLGQSQGHANVRDNQFDKALADNHTMATVLKEAGYATAAVGKWGLMGLGYEPPHWPAHPLKRGFDYFLGYMRHSDGHTHYPKEGPIRGRKQLWRNYTNITEKLDTTYTTDLFTAAAKRWITSHVQSDSAENHPFFMYLAYDTPHAPMTVPPQPYPEGGGLEGGVQWIGKGGHFLNTSGGELDGWIHPDYANATYDHDGDPSTPQKPWPASYKRYATSVRRIDSGVGDLMKLLKDLGIRKNTLVIFTSDNGPTRASYLPRDEYVNYEPTFFESFGPFEGVKKDTWEGGLRMPALASWPGRIPPDTIIHEPSISYDWLPTFADAAGLPLPANTDGVSLVPRLTGQNNWRASDIYVEYYDDGHTPRYQMFGAAKRGRKREQMQMIRMGRYVGVRYQIKSAADDFEIFNVVEDPAQRSNLAANPERPTKIQRLQQKMKRRVLRVRRPNPSASRPYDDAPVPALTEAEKPDDLAGGLHWKRYNGKYPWVPLLARKKADSTGIISHPTAEVSSNPHQVLVFEGFLRIPETGSYTFYLKAADGAVVRIHEALLFDADYGYKAGTRDTSAVRLEKGFHPVKINYLRKKNPNPQLQLEWSGPNIQRQELSAGNYYRERRL